MSERKVLNKYYPPDFDPSKIPKLRLARNRQYSIRIMAPFNMRCNTCGEYIYKGKKFNSRKETVEDEDYLGLKIFRFYIKCPRCVAEIAFKTDPQNTDYSLEGGATRNFEAMRTAELLAKKEIEEKEQEELNNPMKVLENRTKASQQEMEMIETLEELRDLNSRNAKVDHESLVKLHEAYEEQLTKLQDEEDEKFIQSMFGKVGSDGGGSVKRLQDDSGAISDGTPPLKKANTMSKPTDLLTTSKGPEKTETGWTSKSTGECASWQRSVGTLSSSRKTLSGLVVRRKESTPGGATAGGTTTRGGGQAVGRQTPTAAMSQPDTGGGAKSQPTGGLGLGLLGAYTDSDSDGNADST